MVGAWTWALLGLASVSVSAMLTLAWMKLAHVRQWLDLPGERRLHDIATPRGGGIGIGIIALLTMLWLSGFADHERSFWRWSALGLLACAGAGLLDDLGLLHRLGKMLMQLVSAVFLVLAVQALQEGVLGWQSMAGMIVCTLLLVNFCNFMDGSNGLLTVQVGLILVGLLLLGALAAAPMLLAIVVLAAALGFLPFNFPTARVFLGDVGSHALGYVLALLLCRAWSDAGLTLPLGFLLLSALLMDAGLTLMLRMLSGQRFWQPHCEHLYQWALRLGFSHPRV